MLSLIFCTIFKGTNLLFDRYYNWLYGEENIESFWHSTTYVVPLKTDYSSPPTINVIKSKPGSKCTIDTIHTNNHVSDSTQLLSMIIKPISRESMPTQASS